MIHKTSKLQIKGDLGSADSGVLVSKGEIPETGLSDEL